MSEENDKGRELVELMKRQRGGREEQVFTWLALRYPEYMEALNKIHVLVNGYEEPPPAYDIGLKMQELIVLAVTAAQRDWDRYTAHLGRALTVATEEEIAQVLMVSAQISGSPAIRTGLQIMLDMKAGKK